MRAIIYGTDMVVKFSCTDREGNEVAGGIMHNWGAEFCGYDADRGMHIIKWADAEWWFDILSRIEKLEAAGVDWNSCDFRCETDLGMVVEDLEMTMNENEGN